MASFCLESCKRVLQERCVNKPYVRAFVQNTIAEPYEKVISKRPTQEPNKRDLKKSEKRTFKSHTFPKIAKDRVHDSALLTFAVVKKKRIKEQKENVQEPYLSYGCCRSRTR